MSFAALGLYDLKAFGGNGDGVINQHDKIFSRLRIWVDLDHDGVSEPAELLTLKQAGIESIYLNYEAASWTDAYGNRFLNRATVVRTPNMTGGLWAYDVALVAGQ